MIITKTPYRISLFGGGTDHPDWYRENGGAVVSFAIDKYCYLSARILPPFFDHHYRVVYSKVETTKDFSEIKHPAVREGIRKYAPNLQLEIQHHGDLPAQSGVGSSSAFAVGLIDSLLALQGKTLSPRELAQAAIDLEQRELKESVGSQDQIACTLGGLNFIQFGPKELWTAQPLELDEELKASIESRVVMIFSGVKRSSSDISRSFLENLDMKHRELKRTEQLAYECRELLTRGGALDQIGEMLTESWELKRKMNPASVTPELQDLFDQATRHGALGGKILGAGGGGFCMFWLNPDRRESFLSDMKMGVQVPIKISNEGTVRLSELDSE